MFCHFFISTKLVRLTVADAAVAVLNCTFSHRTFDPILLPHFFDWTVMSFKLYDLIWVLEKSLMGRICSAFFVPSDSISFRICSMFDFRDWILSEWQKRSSLQIRFLPIPRIFWVFHWHIMSQHFYFVLRVCSPVIVSRRLVKNCYIELVSLKRHFWHYVRNLHQLFGE